MDNIVAIKIIFENGDNILINKKEFVDFYISNLNNKGEEIPYEPTLLKNKLYANFCLLKLNNQVIDYTKINRLKQKNDIIPIYPYRRKNAPPFEGVFFHIFKD